MPFPCCFSRSRTVPPNATPEALGTLTEQLNVTQLKNTDENQQTTQATQANTLIHIPFISSPALRTAFNMNISISEFTCGSLNFDSVKYWSTSRLRKLASRLEKTYFNSQENPEKILAIETLATELKNKIDENKTKTTTQQDQDKQYILKRLGNIINSINVDVDVDVDVDVNINSDLETDVDLETDIKYTEQILNFMRGEATNRHSLSINEILEFNDEKLLTHSNFIQYLFPLDTTSPYETSAPLITKEIKEFFLQDSSLRDAQRRSLDRILSIYNLKREGDSIFRLPSFNIEKNILMTRENSKGKRNKLKSENPMQSEINHCWRLTRIIQSLYLLENKILAKSLQIELLDAAEKSGLEGNKFFCWEMAFD